MTKIIISILIVIATIGVSNAGDFSREELISQLPAIANEISKNLPMTIDKETQLDSVLGFDETLTYLYSLINFKAEDVTQDMKNFLHKQGINGYCSVEGPLKIFKENNITMKIMYRGKDGKFATSFSMNSSSCN